MPRSPSLSGSLALLVLCFASGARAQAAPASGAPATAAAAPQAPLEPPRYVLSLSAGVPLRLTKNVDFDQSSVAPAFGDVMAGYVLEGSGVHRHGLGIGMSMNLTDDGGFTEPVPANDQLVLMPAYLGLWQLDPDLFALGHLGLPFLVSGGSSVGLELAFGLGYRVRAGAGFFAELGADAFVGASSTLHPTLSVEAGLFIDYEALP